jgi:hypothetical protein
MADLCFDVFGIAKEKKDTNSIKGNRGTTYTPIYDTMIKLLSHLSTLPVRKCTPQRMLFSSNYCSKLVLLVSS